MTSSARRRRRSQTFWSKPFGVPIRRWIVMLLLLAGLGFSVWMPRVLVRVMENEAVGGQ